ncbi:MAG TPA: hypothetical protein VHU82_13335 [Vicinamibacterales bacterium]|nr:hypothetical protein [Vicinamibacterales bacterium]
MTCHRLALRLLACADAFGIGDELIGDLLEEIAHGRSRAWLCHQVLGLYGLAFTKYVRTRARLTPRMVALALLLLLLAGRSVGSAGSVLEAWLGFYAVAGTLSLFAHMASRTFGTRAAVFPAPADAPDAGR